jgi:DNA-binding transcriptional LysR family regulator
MDSRRASYFLAVVDEGSFSAAARALHLSQPALSQAVKELERELGTPLLERLSRRAIPTAAGRAFASHARRALLELSQAREAVLDVLGLVAGSVTLCCLPSLASDPVALAVGAFRHHHPQVQVEILSGQDPDELVEILRSGRAELGVSGALALPSDLVRLPAGSQELQVIFPPGSEVPEPLHLSRLATFDLVTFPPGSSMRTFLDEALLAQGAQARVAVEVAARDAVVPLVLSGAGAALVPKHLADVAAAQGAVVRSSTPRMRRELFVVHRSGERSPSTSAMIDALVAAGSR